MTSLDELSQTRHSYDQIALAYAHARADRAALTQMLDRFMVLVPPRGLVVDVGCGPGFDTAVFQQHRFRAIGLDYSWGMLQAGRQALGLSVAASQGDMRRLPLAADCADGLWVCASLLHLPRAEVPATLREFWRVLKPGGVLMTAVKQGGGERWTPTALGVAAPRFFTYWQEEDLDAALQAAGFSVLDGWTNVEGRKKLQRWLVRFARALP